MLGEKVRERRKELGLSLRELGELTGLSASFLSQIENDQTSPSISSLQTIATALRIPMFTFLDGGVPTEAVVRKNARRTLRFPETRIVYELLTTDQTHQMVSFIVKLEPGACNQARTLYRATEEMMFIIQGDMEIKIDDRLYQLHTGDSIYYEGARLRSYANNGNTDLIVLCSMTPPAL